MRKILSFDELMYIIGLDKYEQVDDGGPGSGNHGHAGRPGKKGGSAKGSGGKALRGGTAATGYYGVKKTEHFQSATSKAKKTFSPARWQRSLNDDERKAIADQHAHLASTTGSTQTLEDYKARIFSMLRGGSEQTVRPQNKPVQGQDITGTFVRNKEVKHEINDVLKQTGFDGAAKVVSKKEFDEMQKANPDAPVFYRSYTAPNRETLDAYDDQLEHESWYVDCGTGGHQYGQGMYTTGVYSEWSGRYGRARTRQQREKGALTQMAHYRKLNERRTNEKVTPPAGIVMKRFFDGRDFVGLSLNDKKISFADETPKQGEVVALQRGYSQLLAIRKGNELLECLPDGTPTKFGSSYNIDTLKGERGTNFMTRSDWKPETISTTRKMMLTPDAKIIDYDDVKPLIRKANTLLKKAAARRQKDTLTKQAKNHMAGLVTDLMQPVVDSVKQDLDYWTKRAQSAERSGEAWSARRYKAYAATAQQRMDKISKVQSAQSRPGEFMDKLNQYALWHSLNALFPGKENPFPKPGKFTDDEKALLEEFSTLKDRTKVTWQDVASWQTMRKVESNRISDEGVAAAMFGYDAINAKGHGASDSYTVILNRTKLIIQDEQVDMRGVG